MKLPRLERPRHPSSGMAGAATFPTAPQGAQQHRRLYWPATNMRAHRDTTATNRAMTNTPVIAKAVIAQQH